MVEERREAKPRSESETGPGMMLELSLEQSAGKDSERRKRKEEPRRPKGVGTVSETDLRVAQEKPARKVMNCSFRYNRRIFAI